MMIKYRVHEVAKDLNVPSKEIIDLLAQHYEEPRKHMTALSEEELNLIFEHYTKKRSVENFDRYFSATAQKAPAPQPAPTPALTPAPAAAPAPAKPAQPRPAVAAAANGAGQPHRQQRPGGGGAQPHAGQPYNGQPHNAPAQAHGHNGPGQNGGQNRQGNRFGGQPPRQNQPHGNPPQQRPAQQQRANPLDRTVRVVDTRGAQVELDKYNEHYEEIAPNASRKGSNMQAKQKINQRSRNRRPYYARRETEAEKLRRLALERKNKPQLKITVPDEIAVGELAARLKVTAANVIKKLIAQGVMASISDMIDYDTATLIAMDFGAKVEKEVVVTIEDRLIDDSEDKEEDLQPRSPVVVVMGHVDHGKTTLLDAIRHSDVASGEAGGITQHIGAYRVKVQEREVTFLDTPGHEAFTSMRARGAQITDIAVLVVAADDGIMPQTVEAINHAKAAEVTIIVAVNKIDKPGANPQRVMQQLTEYGLVPEEWGGDTICVPISAAKHQNIDKLLEMILLVADMKNLRANPNRAGKGSVIEARLDKGRGAIATVLVQNGTLHTGDLVVAGTSVGRIRAMTDENGRTVTAAGPSVPVEVTGLSEAPEAGDIVHAVQDERMARELVEQRRHEEKEEHFKEFQKVTLDNLFDQMQQGEVKELGIIVKADVQGSVEAVRQSLEKLSNDEVRVNVIHGGVGAISESDVMLAEASNAIIVGFNVRPDPAAKKNAELGGVDMRMYRVIYDCIDEIKAAMKGMLAPKTREVDIGRVEVRQVYHISSVGTVSGCYVLDGKVTRAAKVRVVRDGIVVADDEIGSLKRFKDDAKEVQQGFECGITLEKFSDVHEKDVFECYGIEEYQE